MAHQGSAHDSDPALQTQSEKVLSGGRPLDLKLGAIQLHPNCRKMAPRLPPHEVRQDRYVDSVVAEGEDELEGFVRGGEGGEDGVVAGEVVHFWEVEGEGGERGELREDWAEIVEGADEGEGGEVAGDEGEGGVNSEVAPLGHGSDGEGEEGG